MVEMNLQFFGGRGASYSSQPVETISPFMARIFFNAAKHSDALRNDERVKKDSRFEKAIQTMNEEYVKSMQTKKEARQMFDYITDRIGETQRKLVKLGSPEAVYKEKRLASEYKKLSHMHLVVSDKLQDWQEKPKELDRTLQHKRTTTTYERARKNRIKDFDAWFYGNGGKK